MSDRPLFSIVVTTFDRAAYLRQALESVRRQTVTDWECIVVDDASPVPVRVPQDARFRLVRRDSNGGEPVARNTGLRAARGSYVAFLDDDDLFTPDRLEHALQGLGKAPVSVCWRRGLDGSTGGNRLLEGDVRDRILDNLTPQLGQVAIHRSIVPRFDERYAGGPDVEWWLRVATEWPVSSVPRVGLLYRQHTGPRNRNGLRARIDGSLRLLEEHADYFATHPRAAAFRWKRIGLTARRTRDLRFARTAFLRSLRLRPQISTAWHLVRVLRSSGSAVGNIEESRAA